MLGETMKTKQVLCGLIDRDITIQEFAREEAQEIVDNRYFYTLGQFKAFVVALCIVDFEEVMSELIEREYFFSLHPDTITELLYQRVLIVNGFMDYREMVKGK